MKTVGLLVLLAAVGLNCTSGFGADINFSGISLSSLPQTFNFGSGSVTVSKVTLPVVGTAGVIQYIPSPGTNGDDGNSVGGVYQKIIGTGTGPDSWELKLAFSQPETITVHNIETYCNFEETSLQSDNPNWTQLSGSSNLVVAGLGTNTLSLVGANGPTGPFGYGYWSTTTQNLYMTYTLNETAGGTAGNGIEIAVPEPAPVLLLGLGCAGILGMRRRRVAA